MRHVNNLSAANQAQILEEALSWQARDRAKAIPKTFPSQKDKEALEGDLFGLANQAKPKTFPSPKDREALESLAWTGDKAGFGGAGR